MAAPSEGEPGIVRHWEACLISGGKFCFGSHAKER